jgi:uncharacterized membrane-anchored protein YhcB (DUF1043 family)
MNMQNLAKTLEISPEKLSSWIAELGITFLADDAGEIQIPDNWVAYFKQIKALFSSGKKAADILKAVPMPEKPLAASEAKDNPNSKQVLQETFRQMEMRIVSMQFHLKNTQSEMVKEQKNLAKAQKQVEDLTRTVDVLQKTIISSQKSNEEINHFMGRYWLYQALTVVITVLLVLILGRLFAPSTPQQQAIPPAASTNSDSAQTDGTNFSETMPSASPSL